MAQLFAMFEKECPSLVSQGLKQVRLDLAEFGTLMARVSKRVIAIRPDLHLTLAGTDVINTKFKALTVLTSKLAIFEGQLRKVLRRLQICNSQMHAQVSKSCRQELSFCSDSPLELPGRSLWSS